jgi:hypothetical protein
LRLMSHTNPSIGHHESTDGRAGATIRSRTPSCPAPRSLVTRRSVSPASGLLLRPWSAAAACNVTNVATVGLWNAGPSPASRGMGLIPASPPQAPKPHGMTPSEPVRPLLAAPNTAETSSSADPRRGSARIITTIAGILPGATGSFGMRAWAAGTLAPQPAANCLLLLVFLFSPKNFGNP